MIEKRIKFKSSHDNCSVDKISFDAPLEKVASRKMSDEIREFIAENIEKDPDYVYVLVSALGSGEYWGPNINADYFPEEEIKDSFKTFEEFGHVFTHHQNKDPKKSKGDILLAHYNPRMKRVELVVRLDRSKAPEICKDLDDGKMWDVSMGCKVPFDVCSICGNKARTESQYCSHIDHNRGEVLDDGRQIYMINRNPRFFDISFVHIGADRTAKSLLKIASSKTKESAIDKEVPGETVSKEPNDVAKVLMEGFKRLKRREKDLPREILGRLSEHNLSETLSTLANQGVVLKPKEFKTIYSGEPFKLSPNRIHGAIKKAIRPYLKSRSGLKQHLYPRIIRCSNKEPKSDPKITVVYKKYLKGIPKITRHSGIPTSYMSAGIEGVDLPEGNWDSIKRGLEDNIPSRLLNDVTLDMMEKLSINNELLLDSLAGKAIKRYF